MVDIVISTITTIVNGTITTITRYIPRLYTSLLIGLRFPFYLKNSTVFWERYAVP